MIYPSVKLYSLSQLKNISKNFCTEIEKAKNGSESSLSFIENNISKNKFNTDTHKFQVMVIGGSKFETAIVEKIDRKIKFVNYKVKNLPLMKNKNVFLTFIKNNLYKNIDLLSVNFAYALKPLLRNGILDGILISVSKEHEFKGLINKKIGEEIEKYFEKEIKVTVANDLVCLVLSTKGDFKEDEVVGGVVGTGINFGGFSDRNHVVNLESGNFNKFKQTKSGKQIDKESIKPTEHIFEKEVSGAYLYKHFNIICNKVELKSTKELSGLAEQKGESEISKIAQKLIKRSASLIASKIAGVSMFKKNKDLVVIIEGSLFWNGWNYKNMVMKYSNRILGKNSIKFIKIENSNLKGAAKLVV